MEERTVELIWVKGESNQRQVHKGHLRSMSLLMLSRNGEKRFFNFPDLISNKQNGDGSLQVLAY